MTIGEVGGRRVRRIKNAAYLSARKLLISTYQSTPQVPNPSTSCTMNVYIIKVSLPSRKRPTYLGIYVQYKTHPVHI